MYSLQRALNFWDATLCSLVVHQCFRGLHCLHLQDHRVKQENNEKYASRKLSERYTLLKGPICQIFLLQLPTTPVALQFNLYLSLVTHVIFLLSSPLVQTWLLLRTTYLYSSPCSYRLSLGSYPGQYHNMFSNCLLLISLFFLGHWLLGSQFSHEDGSSTFLRNISEGLPEYMVSHPRR